MLNNIPLELRALAQWVVWRLELREGHQEGEKPTKVPYNWKTGRPASVTNPNDWTTFNEACACNLGSVLPVPFNTPVSLSGYSGIGFVFTADDDYCGVDLDDTHGDAGALADQRQIYDDLNSYSEHSVSGTGLHIIVKGKLPPGRRRRYFVEVYDQERYFTMTGNVFNPAPIAERNDELFKIVAAMGAAEKDYPVGVDKPQTQTDDEVVTAARSAVNGDKFAKLWTGDCQSDYGSQSEADFALVDIIAFYTQNREQIARIFRASALGQREKAKRDKYIWYMVEKSFDRQLPAVDTDFLREQFNEMMRAKGAEGGKPGGNPPSDLCDGIAGETAIDIDNDTSHAEPEEAIAFPPGLVGEVAQFIYDAAPRPVATIALAGAIGMLSGITGRAYNINGAGLNQYIILLARTGRGKDAITDGIAKLIAAVKVTVPTVTEYEGPGQLVSAPGIINWIRAKPCCFSIVGEIGLMMKQMVDPRAPPHLVALQRTLTEMYSKNGKDKVFASSAYAEKDKNGAPCESPSFTLIGEGVPDTFYSYLSEELVSGGMVPRFLVYEYLGKRVALNKSAYLVKPPLTLVQKLADVAGQCQSLAYARKTQDVLLDPKATALFDQYEAYTTALINKNRTLVNSELWNRAHIKAMKLAAVCAIGINYLNPIVTEHEAVWAINTIDEQTKRLVKKFDDHETGIITGTEADQLDKITQCIASYLMSPFDRYRQYGGTPTMHRDKVVLHDHISRRMIAMATFRNDRLGPTAAIKRIIGLLLDNADLIEVPKTQVKQLYGKAAKAYAIGDAGRFSFGGSKSDTEKLDWI